METEIQKQKLTLMSEILNKKLDMENQYPIKDLINIDKKIDKLLKSIKKDQDSE